MTTPYQILLTWNPPIPNGQPVDYYQIDIMQCTVDENDSRVSRGVDDPVRQKNILMDLHSPMRNGKGSGKGNGRGEGKAAASGASGDEEEGEDDDEDVEGIGYRFWRTLSDRVPANPR
jgi:hypothetical protein